MSVITDILTEINEQHCLSKSWKSAGDASPNGNKYHLIAFSRYSRMEMKIRHSLPYNVSMFVCFRCLLFLNVVSLDRTITCYKCFMLSKQLRYSRKIVNKSTYCIINVRFYS